MAVTGGVVGFSGGAGSTLVGAGRSIGDVGIAVDGKLDGAKSGPEGPGPGIGLDGGLDGADGGPEGPGDPGPASCVVASASEVTGL